MPPRHNFSLPARSTAIILPPRALPPLAMTTSPVPARLRAAASVATGSAAAPRPRATAPASPAPALSPALARSIAGRLAGWFGEHAREMPWRQTLDPYGIWVSEIMLQQTQVRTVIPYWERWMQTLPTALALAESSPERVLKLWEGLGYYSRARNLQKAASQIVTAHGGRFPEDFDSILALPGIGRYTAGAVASIAFNQPRPIVDGNVIRVLARLFALDGNARERPVTNQLWDLSTQLVEAAARRPLPAIWRKPGRRFRCSGTASLFNQSIMELGATVCLPQQPDCAACPLRECCRARREGRVALLPNLGARPTPTLRRFVALLVRHKDRWLVQQRPKEVVNGQLWEFPNREVTSARMTPGQVARSLLGERVGRAPLQRFHTLQHSITRYRIALEAHRMDLEEAPEPAAPPEPGAAAAPQPVHRWLRLAELEQLAFPSAHRKLLRRLQAER